mmetsp:Transcript_24902/g.28683  ORF Transcript_24902/g.28683 Transcript_24902/m.28683 type:complete len:348 (+) Transcript_24902:687-1730(+)
MKFAVYQNSQKNIDDIEGYGGICCFGVDATNLESYRFFPIEQEGEKSDEDKTQFAPFPSFDRIVFNFPHWKGKANNKYNRLLLSNFLQSAADCISCPDGEVHIALVDHQGGSCATTNSEWKGSWLAAQYGAESGLLLCNVQNFKVAYDLSSHRGVDRPFSIGKAPMLYKFTKPSSLLRKTNDNFCSTPIKSSVPKHLQLCCRHELHVLLNSDAIDKEHVKLTCDNDIDSFSLCSIIQGIVPDGIEVEIPMMHHVRAGENDSFPDTAVYTIVYCGKHRPVTRTEADFYRKQVEEIMPKYMSLRENRLGRTVSKPFPYMLLPHLIDDHMKNQYGGSKIDIVESYAQELS